MLITTQGIVFRSVKYSETSLILDIYTRDFGLKTYIASGVRQTKSVIAPMLLRPAALLEFTAYQQPQKDINRLKEAKPLFVYQRVPFEVVRGGVALFVAELLQKCVKESEKNEALFDFLAQVFRTLDGLGAGLANFPIAVLVQLPRFLGFAPNLDSLADDCYFDYREGHFTPDTPRHLHYWQPLHADLFAAFWNLPLADAHQIALLPDTRREFLEDLLDFYSYHIEGFVGLKSYEVLKVVL